MGGRRRTSVQDNWERNSDESPTVLHRTLVISPSCQLAASDSGSNTNHDTTYTLTYFQALLQATVLEDVITKFNILVACNNELKMTKFQADMSLHLALKYNISQPQVKDELDGIDPTRLQCSDYKLIKLENDRNFAMLILNDTYTDLVLTKGYSILVHHINSIIDTTHYRDLLFAEELSNRATRRELNKRVRQQRNHFKSVIYDTDVIIDSLKTQVEDAALNADIRSRYVENWQIARTEQHFQTICDKENIYGEVIDYYKNRCDHEQRVHTEVELLINIAINETLDKVELWMDKYDTDMEAMDLKIQLKKNDYKNMLDKKINLEETIEQHDKLMKSWIQFKEEREKIRQYRESMTTSAVIVQSWWRGILVRLQLGPYKVVKKKQTKAEKKKK